MIKKELKAHLFGASRKSWPGLRLVTFDQGRLGHQRKKPTTVLTNLPAFEELHGLQGEGCDDSPLPTKLADRIRTSRSWAAWAPGLVAAIKESLRRLLGVLEEEGRNGDAHNMSKMDLAAWHRHIKQGHIPFRADCRICGEAMGCDKPHKRLGGSATKFTMSADLCGPFPAGRDLGTGVTCKYALISTVAVPIVSELPGEVAEPYDTADDVKHTEDLPCDPEEREMLSDDEVQRLNALAQIEEAQEAPGHQNITFAEVIPDRTVESLVRALSRLHAKYRMLGIQVYRLHTDRERSFASVPIQKWCEQRQLRLTLTAGDDSKANGRIEGEVNQIKRRTRLLLHDSGLPQSLWPTALRHAAEGRVRLQLERLGLPSPPMLRYGASVLVKSKRWHRAGQLSMPYRTMQLLGPCPYMSHGWIARDKKGQLLHVRTALEPSPVADQAIMDLQEVPSIKHRIVGKHPPPLPDHPLAGAVGALYDKSDPALAACRAGGEDPLPLLDEVGRSLALQFEDEGDSEEVVGGPTPDSLDQGDQCQHPDLPGELEDPMCCSRQQAEQWHELEQQRHWALKQLWCQGLREVAVGEDAGSVHGSWLREVELLLRGAEDQLSFQHSSLQNYKMASLAPMAGSTEVPVTVLQTYTVSLQQVRKELEKWKPPLRDEYGQLVSSTQAIKPTTEEKLRLDPRFPTMELAPAMLVPTVKSPHGRLRARVVICGNHLTKVNEDQDNSASEMKAKDQAPYSLYAGGADGTTLRCLMRCAAQRSWSIGTVDIKTAFLLAPRPDERERLLVARPPRVLVEAGICPPTELWEISHAVYGLNDAPANWSHYRDRELPQLRFKADGHEYQLVTTPEPNLWKLVKTQPNSIPEEDTSEGFLAVYVDDMLVAAPSPLAQAVIDGIRARWRCSEPEWASSEKSLKFCGFEIKCRPGEVILNQTSYTRDLLARHEGIKSRQTPLPLGVQDELEENISIEQVRKAQALVGELLWLSGRTRPDLSYGVSIMGRLVTKAPGKVLEWGAHMLGYLHSTVDYELCYTKQVFEAPSIESEAAKLPSVRVFSDASHGPQGGRGQQGLLVTYNGSPVQWESRQQPFATLSSAESELMGYVDGVVMGESVAAIVNILEDHKLHFEGEQVLCGDSQTVLKILVAPDGPWRTRHLRLRAYVIKERIQQQCWRTLHVPGTELPSDLLTKPIVNPTSWQRFFQFLGARVPSGIGQKEEHQSVCSRLQAVVAGILGMAVWNPIHEAHKIARCLTVTALVAYLASKAQDLKKIIGHLPAESQTKGPRGRDSVETRSVREDEPTALGGEEDTRSVREDEPTAGLGGRAGDISLRGSRAAAFEPRCHGHGVRLAAMRAEPSTESGTWTVAGPHEWPQFRLPPQGRDRWGRLRDGWWVRHHVKPRKRPFHPVHRQTPFDAAQIRSGRVTVVWLHGEKSVVEDDWRSGTRPMVPTEEQWVGYSFFRDNPPQPPLPEHATLDSQTSSSTPAGQTTGSSSTPTPPGQSLSTSQVSASSGPPPVRPEEELLRGIRRVRRGSTDSSTGTLTSTLSSTMTASTRGMDAMEAPLTLGYLGRMRGQENRGERPAPANMQVPLEEERSDWILSLHSEGLLLARHPNLPDEATPQWLGIQMPVARSSRPAGAGRPSEASRPAARSEGNRPAARSSSGPMPINEEWDSDGSYELLEN